LGILNTRAAAAALYGAAPCGSAGSRDATAIGRSITLDSRNYTIIGMLPADFRFAFFGPSSTCNR
jgi:hypothetical protein